MREAKRPLALPDRFSVGAFVVVPASNAITFGGDERRLEPKVMDVLCVLAEMAGDTVSRGEIIDRVWGRDFGGDESLTRAISQLRKTFSIDPGDGEYILTTPKRGYRLVAPVGAPGVAPVAPEFGSSRNAKIDPSPKVRRLALVLAVAAAAVLGLFAPRLFTSVSATDEKIIIVSEFEIYGRADGDVMRETALLEDALARDLVRSGFIVADKNAGSGAALRIEGSVYGGDKPSAIIHIAHVRSGHRIWSRSFGLHSGNASTEISNSVSDVVACGLSAAAPDDTPVAKMDSVLLSFFFRGCGDFRTMNFSSMIESGRLAYARAPESVAAIVYYATAAAYGALSAWSKEESDALRSLARHLAAEAEALDTTVFGADVAAGIAAISEMDWRTADERLSRAAASAADHRYAYNAQSMFLRRVGRLGEAIDVKRRAVEADRHSLSRKYELAILLTEAGHRVEAQNLIDGLSDVYPREACMARLQLDYFTGDARSVLTLLKGDSCARPEISQEQLACSEAFLNARLGVEQSDRARSLCSDDALFDPVRYLAALGLTDEAVDLALSREIRWDQTPFLFYREMDAFRRDPRFMKVAARYQLTDYWIDSRRWPDFCAEPGFPYDCRQAALALRL